MAGTSFYRKYEEFNKHRFHRHIRIYLLLKVVLNSVNGGWDIVQSADITCLLLHKGFHGPSRSPRKEMFPEALVEIFFTMCIYYEMYFASTFWQDTVIKSAVEICMVICINWLKTVFSGKEIMKRSGCVSSFSLGQALAHGWGSIPKWQKAAGTDKPSTMKLLFMFCTTNRQMRDQGKIMQINM